MNQDCPSESWLQRVRVENLDCEQVATIVGRVAVIVVPPKLLVAR